MLRLVLQGSELDIDISLKISLIIENPLFVEDRIPISHSLTFTLPPTERNLSLLGRPDRLASIGGFGEFLGLEIFFGPERLMYGTLVVKKFSAAIECHFRNSGLVDQIKTPLNQLSLEQYDFGAGWFLDVDFEDTDNFGYKYKTLIRNSRDGSDLFVAAPVRIKEESWRYISPQAEPDIPDNHGFNNLIRMYANKYIGAFIGESDNGYVFKDEINDTHSYVFPQPWVWYIIEQIFGDALISNIWFENEILRNLIIGNIYHPNYIDDVNLGSKHGLLLSGISMTTGPEAESYIRLNDFLSYQNANDLVKDLMKLISATMFYKGDTIDIRYNSDILADNENIPWTEYLIDEPDKAIYPAKSYNYGYESINETENPAAYPTIDTIEDLNNLVISTEGDTVERYVVDQNQVLSKTYLDKTNPTDQDRFAYEVIHSGFDGSPSNGDSSYPIKSGIIPLFNSIHEYWFEDYAVSGITFYSWYVPQFDGDRNPLPNKPYILFYHGIQETLSDKFSYPGIPADYPFASAHNYDSKGNKVGDLSLQWHGDDGLLNTFHLPFKQFIETDKKYIKAYFKLSSTQIKNLDLSKKYYVRAKNFFIEKLQVDIEYNKINPALVDLIEAIDV